MTTPQPPESESFIKWGIHEAKAAELRCRQVHLSYHLVLVVLAVLLFFGGVDAWRWHIAKLARLEVESHAEQTKATNEHALGEQWHAKAIALADSVRVDTVQVRKIVERTRTITVQVPVMPVAAQDGVTYSGAVPMVEIEVVPRTSFDSLGAACSRVEHDCGSALAAKDSALAHLQAQTDALNARIAADVKARTSERRAARVGKLIWGGVGVLLGHFFR